MVTRWIVFWLLITLLGMRNNPAQADLEGEVMKISELNNGALDLEKVKIFECPEGQNCEAGRLNREPSCVDRRRMFGIHENSSDKYVIVAAEVGRTVQLDCHYCNEKDDQNVPKVWYYYEKFLASKRFRVVPLHLDYPEDSRKFVVNDDDHRLSIRNFTEADGALYFCQALEDTSSKFDYLVDAVGQSNELEPKRGNFEDYVSYYKENIAPLNKKLKDEYKSDLKKWFQNDKHNYNVSHKWSKWGNCHSCGRLHGVRMRTGTCELAIPALAAQNNSDSRKVGGMNFGYKFSCHSAMLKRFLSSNLRKKLNEIVDFIEELPCEAECNLPAIGSAHGAAFAQDQDATPPPTLTVFGTIGNEITLLCSGNPSADIVWLKNNSLLMIPDAQRSKVKRSKVLTYTRNRGGIYFPVLSKDDEGIYTCISEDVVKMIFKLETQEPVGDPEIPETWIWVHLSIFSILCFVIWILIVVFIARVTWRTQSEYQPLSTAEEKFLKRKRALMEGYDDQGGSQA